MQRVHTNIMENVVYVLKNIIATEITSNVNTTWFCTLLLKTNIISEFQSGRIFNHLFVRVETKRKLHKQSINFKLLGTLQIWYQYYNRID